MELIKKIYRKLFPKYSIYSYSQEGEDLILNRYFDSKKFGFYLDIGAHHPKRFSNTYLFYKKGWKGVNIDAMPGSMKPFKKIRPRDINIEQAISSRAEELTFYIYKEKALNTFSKDLVDYRTYLNPDLLFDRKIKIFTKRLDYLLNDINCRNLVIDFMSIDVEGYDMEVLQSNNWERYIPRLILIEILATTLDQIKSHPITIFLQNQNYHIYAKCINTVIYRHDSEYQ
jgi:FkbM family methyltransferase